jgi:hypothetical protein
MAGIEEILSEVKPVKPQMRFRSDKKSKPRPHQGVISNTSIGRVSRAPFLLDVEPMCGFR